ncbi:hypothetical protein GWG65_27445 [Bradyrhizobium sp. CSA207]|uniref:hypothetical protein n=1 Tax=Bradyrhizobium sp. CSA207 TaxID=2698826 RepID=UPI0023AE9828|nr:hypothetical protein [Bradyrhizobium sp. CSA207]MDE5445113.1 hypothetical protein [Bradyrhizobium sp. CSA207]
MVADFSVIVYPKRPWEGFEVEVKGKLTVLVGGELFSEAHHSCGSYVVAGSDSPAMTTFAWIVENAWKPLRQGSSRAAASSGWQRMQMFKQPNGRAESPLITLSRYVPEQLKKTPFEKPF